MHYYQFNIGDYKSHTEHLSEMEDLTYRRLLDWYYLHESPIPLENSETARQIRMRLHIECIASVLSEFFTETKDGWIHHRADKEIEKAGEKSEKASASARARWSKNAKAMRTHSEGNATQDTKHITQDTKHITQAIQTPDGVSANVWSDFMKHRKALKAPITDTAIAGFTREADKAGITLEQSFVVTIENNWRGFKAEWLKDKNSSRVVNKQEALEARNRAVGRAWAAKTQTNGVIDA